MERLTWAYDTPENTPWIRALILETAGVTEDLKHYPNTRFVPLAIEKSQYNGMIRNPAMYDAQMGFSSWDIPELTGAGDAFTDSIKNGANNKRILGRLALLFPNNYLAVTNAITGALEQLNTLDTKEVNKDFARTGEKVQIDIERDTYIYVIGTLCGGTSSGGFIDLGYILRTLPGYQNVTTTGIFLLPSAAHRNMKHVANVYAALTELNHYSSDSSRYRQQVANRTIATERGTRPYDYTYLVQARGAAEEEYAKLVTGISDYIYSDVIGGTADRRDDTRTNIADYFGVKDKQGATQKYFTFGLGTIEFPYIRVAKACSLQLTIRGLNELIGKAELTDTEAANMVNSIPLMRLPDMVMRLLQRRDTTSNLRPDIEMVLNAGRTTVTLQDLSITEAQIEVAFVDRGVGTQHEKLPHNIIATTVSENRLPTRTELLKALNEKITGFIMGPDARGLLDLKTFLNRVEDRLVDNIAKTKKMLPDPIAQATAARAQKQAVECQRSVLLAVTLYKKQAVRRFVDRCIDNRILYYQSRLNAFCSQDCDASYQYCLDYIRRVKGRLENAAGLEKEALTIREQMEQLYRTIDTADGGPKDGSVRVINGVELFTPGQTIPSEYRRCLLEKGTNRPGQFNDFEKAFGMEALQQTYVREARELLLADINTDTRFDLELRKDLPRYDEYQLLNYARPARPYFSALNSTTIVSRLLAQKDQLRQRLQSVSEASRLFLNINPGHPRHEEAVNKSYKFVFYATEDDRTGELENQVQGAHIMDAQGGISGINDHQQIMVLNERGAFSLGIIEELLSEGDGHWRDVSLQTPAQSHTRGDVLEWIGWEESYEKMLMTSRNIFLVGIALGVIIQRNAVQYQFLRPPTQLGETEPITVLLSNDLDIASQTIRANNIKADIEKRIRDHRDRYMVDDMFERINNFVVTSDQKFTLGPRTLSKEEIRNFLMDYLRTDNELWAKFKETYKSQAEMRYLKAGSDGVEAYYCPCEKAHFLGNNASDLYVTVQRPNGPITRLQCNYCKRSLE